MRPCPHCEFLIADDATSCQYCRRELTTPMPAAAALASATAFAVPEPNPEPSFGFGAPVEPVIDHQRSGQYAPMSFESQPSKVASPPPSPPPILTPVSAPVSEPAPSYAPRNGDPDAPSGYITAPQSFVYTDDSVERPRRDVPWVLLAMVIVMLGAAATIGMMTWQSAKEREKEEAAKQEAVLQLQSDINALGWQTWTFGAAQLVVSAPGLVEPVLPESPWPYVWSSINGDTAVTIRSAPAADLRTLAGGDPMVWARTELTRGQQELVAEVFATDRGDRMVVDTSTPDGAELTRSVMVSNGDSLVMVQVRAPASRQTGWLGIADRVADSVRS